MSYATVQILILLLLALFSGAAIGLWIGIYRQRSKELLTQQELSGLREQYEQTTQENNQLRKKLQHTERNRAKAVSLLDASNDYGYFLQTRKELEDSRHQSAEHLQKLREQEQHIVQLTSILRSIQSDGDSDAIGTGIFNQHNPSS